MTGSDDGYNAPADYGHGMDCDCCSCEHERGNVTEEECEVQPVTSTWVQWVAEQKARVGR